MDSNKEKKKAKEKRELNEPADLHAAHAFKKKKKYADPLFVFQAR